MIEQNLVFPGMNHHFKGIFKILTTKLDTTSYCNYLAKALQHMRNTTTKYPIQDTATTKYQCLITNTKHHNPETLCYITISEPLYEFLFSMKTRIRTYISQCTLSLKFCNTVSQKISVCIRVIFKKAKMLNIRLL